MIIRLGRAARLATLAALLSAVLVATAFQSRAAAFSTGWTHITAVGYGYGLFYNAKTGLAVDGVFTPQGDFQQHQSYTFSTGWTHIVGAEHPAPPGSLQQPAQDVLAYNSNTGFAATWRHGTTCETYGFSPGWTHVASNRHGLVVFYNAQSGEAVTGFLDDCRFSHAQIMSLSPGWTSIAMAGPDKVIFYRSDGVAITGTIDANGVLTEQQKHEDLSANWTHVVGNDLGMLMFYDSGETMINPPSTRIAASLYQDSAGGLTGNRTYTPFSKWTHVTAFGNNVVFFYNKRTGAAASGVLDSGGFRQTR